MIFVRLQHFDSRTNPSGLFVEIENECNCLDKQKRMLWSFINILAGCWLCHERFLAWQSVKIILVLIYVFFPSKYLLPRLEETKMIFSSPSSWQKPWNIFICFSAMMILLTWDNGSWTLKYIFSLLEENFDEAFHFLGPSSSYQRKQYLLQTSFWNLKLRGKWK